MSTSGPSPASASAAFPCLDPLSSSMPSNSSSPKVSSGVAAFGCARVLLPLAWREGSASSSGSRRDPFGFLPPCEGAALDRVGARPRIRAASNARIPAKRKNTPTPMIIGAIATSLSAVLPVTSDGCDARAGEGALNRDLEGSGDGTEAGDGDVDGNGDRKGGGGGGRGDGGGGDDAEGWGGCGGEGEGEGKSMSLFTL